ncbi:ABC transporter G family member 20 [Anopheles arabiensis]|uniref:ABC transporter G family member 20 n=1 Tax=Anopheles arabiensis TaxID=7173 RepID=UPI001AAC6927|nr:ABC transporter G family member 20 [Anopheles arabiensis]XP_040161259.1 ABC transporter G family member 20 [Anopheles arabiensis]XP_040161260.1 ABC transporter G family member 20 [Anopheles arabiensis]XP_040161261.1 ABC transporter G family member 20 [Anopheles arabiensis]XP_040161262.1 ABC transporter G family member 20 [Anopheles arabiensis]
MTAVEVISGYKYYGKANDPNKKIVLNHLNMSVTRGSIYGLLGASGCGKTTLLSCIVGRKFLNDGEINVLGGTPGTAGSGVPGPRIGYMPQDIALVEEFTIKETIYYFGRIYGMSKEKIRERYKLLKHLLELPGDDRYVGNCSGGQQRRVSFAAAMVHEPELLILDEPTVGLDPLLREKIWQYLVETTSTSKMAVIITTHYIEEAKQAGFIGLMRNGILLAEDSPINILERFSCTSLEEAFLNLCQKHGPSEEADRTTHQTATLRAIAGAQDLKKVIPVLGTNEQKAKDGGGGGGGGGLFAEKRKPLTSTIKELVSFTSKRRMNALLSKNFLQMIRQPAGMVFLFLYPIFQLVSFYVAVGGNPKDLRLGIVNEELTNIRQCFNESLITTYYREDYDCDLYKVSCRFLEKLNRSVAIQEYYDTYEDAYRDARKGKILGFIHFSENFTESLQDVRDNVRDADDGSFHTSEIKVYLDKSDQQITFFIEKKLLQTYREFAESLMTDCRLPKQLANIPITFETPVYGTFDEEFTDFMAPGVVMTMIFFLATLITATIFITDRLEGVWDRTIVAGITALELLLAHIITQTSIMLLQCIEIILLATFLFDAQNQGSNITVVGLLMLLGFAGMLYGLLISIFCDAHSTANFMATGSFYPMIILCGILWPLEGMPQYLQYVAYCFPFTIPSIAVRNVLTKGWSITNSQVYMGYGAVGVWIISLLLLCLLGLKIKK